MGVSFGGGWLWGEMGGVAALVVSGPGLTDRIVRMRGAQVQGVQSKMG